MTTTSYHPAAPPDTDGSDLTCEVLISHCADAEFDGDWRYSAFCPDLDAAMDGRSVDEALHNACKTPSASNWPTAPAIAHRRFRPPHGMRR